MRKLLKKWRNFSPQSASTHQARREVGPREAARAEVLEAECGASHARAKDAAAWVRGVPRLERHRWEPPEALKPSKWVISQK